MTAAERRGGEDRILTAPNVITLVRLALIPVFLWLLFGRENRAAAAALLDDADERAGLAERHAAV